MKKTWIGLSIISLIFIVFVISFAYLNNKIEGNKNNEIKLILNPSMITNETTATFQINNNLGRQISFNDTYFFQRLTEVGWQSYPSEIIWTYSLNGVNPGGIYTHRINIEGLITGKYKLIKNINYDDSNINLSTEFSVNRPIINPESSPKYGYRLISFFSMESKDNFNYTVLNLINMGGLKLDISKGYEIEQLINDTWKKFYSYNATEEPVILNSQDKYSQILEIKFLPGHFKLTKDVLVEGYENPIHYSIQFDI